MSVCYESSTKTACIWTHISNNNSINFFSCNFLAMFHRISFQYGNQLKFHPKIGHVTLTGKIKFQQTPSFPLFVPFKL